MITERLTTAQPTAQQLADYANAVILVNSYAYAITNQQLPVLEHPPTNYGEFAEQFMPAKKHALDWSTNIFLGLLETPIVIKEQAANMFDMEKTLIQAYLQTLIADPSNEKAKNGLTNALRVLQRVIDAQVTSISSLEDRLIKFNEDIANDAKILNALSAKALDAVKEDKSKIERIMTDIANIRKSIESAQTLLTVSRIGAGVSLFVGLIGVVVCFIPGGQAAGGVMLAIAIAGEAASIAGWVVEQKRIDAFQREISVNQDQVAAINRDVILLNAVSSQFDALHAANVQAQGALGTIKSMWEELSSTVTEVQTELASVAADNAAGTYQKALDDFMVAERNWNEVVAFANALGGIEYKWQDKDGTWHPYREIAPSADASHLEVVKRAA